MTDTSSLIATHSTSEPFPVTVPSHASPLPNGSLSDTNPQDDEDYTIKCICSYADDDGNTVLCEKCDTWQHIECYYKLYGKEVPDVHLCTDCFPQELDPKRATERQKRQREQNEGGDRRIKRPPSKSHKKKIKDTVVTGEQMNGWHHERHDSSVNGKDLAHPAKKAKHSHRPSASLASLNGHTPSETRKRAFSNLQSYPSPSKSPQDQFRIPSIPLYTSEFLDLYKYDEGNIVGSDWQNPYTIAAANQFSLWKSDPSTTGLSTNPFTYSDDPLALADRKPVARLEETTKPGPDSNGRNPRWLLLRADTDIQKESLVGEIKGEIGLLDEYTQQTSSSNRWGELYHPDSFVFFHPLIPLYIDSRRHGTPLRYLRRSCKPNVTLKTFITSDGKDHHCFVARENITAGTELTTPWYLNPGLFNNDGRTSDGEDLHIKQVEWISRVLANFGDCACDGTHICSLANRDRRGSGKSIERPPKSVGRKRKTKPKQAISPLDTGQATNSRAGSEALRGAEDDDQYDRRSTSTSSRSYARSRDGTPSNPAILDANPVLGDTITARERRKIAAVEEAFKKRDQETQVRRKKKRASGGSTTNTPNASTSKQLGLHSTSNPSTPHVLFPQSDSRFRPLSGSPPPLRPSYGRNDPMESPCRPGSAKSMQDTLNPSGSRYVDAAVQTEPEMPDIPEMPPSKRRKFSTPTQRLLRRLQEDRARFIQSQSPQQTPVKIVPTVAHSTHESKPVAADVEMKDAGVSAMSDSGLSPSSTRSVEDATKSSPISAPPPAPFTMPSQAAHSQRQRSIPSIPQKLHLSTLPPVPTFSNIPSATSITPGSAGQNIFTPSSTMSPASASINAPSFPGLVAATITSPTPMRKKLSLTDYTRRRNLAATPTTEKSQTQASIVPISIAEETNVAPDADPHPTASAQPEDSIKQEAFVQGGLEGSAIDDTPMKDDSDYSPPDVSPVDEQPETIPDLATNTQSKDVVNAAEAVPPMTDTGQVAVSGSTDGIVSPAVANVLAQLQNMSSGKPADAGAETAIVDSGPGSGP